MVTSHVDALVAEGTSLNGLDLLVLVGRRMEAAAGAASNTETWATQDHEQAGQRLADWLSAGDQVLLKGSRGARTESVLDAVRAIREKP